jgi:putative heme iron utilization protein
VNNEERLRLRQLLLEQRWAALATLDDQGTPALSFVAYVPEADFTGFLIHVSRLAAHSRYLLARPHAALGVSAPDTGEGDPQLLARVNIRGTAAPLVLGTPGYLAARSHYLARLPQAEPLFGFEDFVLLRLRPEEARYVGGFARAYSLSGEQLSHLASS